MATDLEEEARSESSEDDLLLDRDIIMDSHNLAEDRQDDSEEEEGNLVLLDNEIKQNMDFEGFVSIEQPDFNMVDSNGGSKIVHPTRIKKDVFHLIETIPVSLKHGMAKEFKRRFRDCLVVFDSSGKQKVEEVLKKQNMTWEEALLDTSKSEWVFKRVRRYIPPSDILISPYLKNYSKLTVKPCVKTSKSPFSTKKLRRPPN